MLDAFWIVLGGMAIIFSVLGILYLIMTLLSRYTPAREKGRERQ
jgi:Na+-transporting methylmalonyl-CoA/oxaloacetate decarboxylase gamma subunit